MKRLMTTALTLALMATTATAALAQERGGRERGGGPREDRGGRQEQRMDRGGDRGDRGSRGGGERGPRQRSELSGQPNYTPTQAAPTAPPAYTQPQRAPGQERGGRDWNRGDNRGGENRDWNRGGDNRNDGRNDGRNDNDRRGGDNRQDWNRGDNDRRDDRRWDNGPRNDNRRWDNDRRGSDRFDRDYRRPSQMRDRDRGRGWYDERRWQRSYHAPRRFRAPAYRPPSGWYARNWGYGDFLPRGWFGSSYYLNWGTYGLGLPPIGTEWVRVGPDALLVDIWTGRVLSVYYGLFW